MAWERNEILVNKSICANCTDLGKLFLATVDVGYLSKCFHIIRIKAKSILICG